MVNDAGLDVVLCLETDKGILGSGDYRLVVLDDIAQQ